MGMNAISMSAAISSSMGFDPEHQRIMRELRAYGIEPSGDKSVDKSKLEQVKSVKNSQKTQFQKPEQKELQQGAKQEEDSSANAYNGNGSDQIAMLNKLRFGLL